MIKNKYNMINIYKWLMMININTSMINNKQNIY